MPLKLDPEVEAGLAPMLQAMASVPKPAVGDIEGRRKAVKGMLEQAFALLPTPTEVTSKDYDTTTSDGHSLLLRWITKTPGAAGAPTPAVVYVHGGGELWASSVFPTTNPIKQE